MKKTLSLVIAVFMLLSLVPTGVFAVAGGSGYGWQWDDNVAYGYIKNYGSSSGSDMVVEMDVSLVRGGEGAKFSYWTTSGENIVYNAVTGTASIGTSTVASYSWGEISGATWHHLKYIFNNGTATFQIDGNTVVSKDNIYAHNSEIMFFADWGILTMDNVKISNNAGTTIMECDFEDAAQANRYFKESGGLGNRVAITTEDPDPTPTDDIGWVARINEYGIIAKDIKKVDYPVNNLGTVEFDLAMAPGTSGSAKLEIFEGYNGSVRITIFPNSVGYFYTPTESESYSAHSWGDLNLTNWRHVKYEHSSDNVKLYIDGNLVYTIGHGCTPALPGLNVYMSEGSAFIDNLVFTDSTGTVHGSFDFEENLPDSEGTQRVYIGNCETHGHVPANRSYRVLDPTCTEDGYNSTACLACGQEAVRTVVPKLGHNFGAYTDGVVTKAPTATADGTVTWTCARCNAATAEGTAVATGDYKGTIIAFDDMQNRNVTREILKGFSLDPTTGNDGKEYPGETFENENGVTYIHSYSDSNYHEFMNVDTTNGYTVSFDFRYNNIFDNGDTADYGHCFYFWMGGENNVGNEIGYDFENNQFFIRSSGGKAYDTLTADYTLEKDTWYNITMKFFNNKANEAWAALYCNGQELVRFDDIDAAFELPYKNASFPILMRFFGVEFDVTNYVVGDNAFEWVNFRTPENEDPVLPGDVNGDGKVNSRDLVSFKRFLSGIEIPNFVEKNADMNGDSKINSRDLVTFKRMLASN